MLVSVCLHANIQYAEIPKSDIPEVVKKCYLPILKMLESLDAKVVVDLSGYTLETLAEKYPEVVEHLSDGIKRKQLELTGCTYSHAILPLLPLKDIELQVKLCADAFQKILSYRLRGFFPPELAWDPVLPSILKRNGFTWTFVDDELVGVSRSGINEYNPFFRRQKTFGENLHSAYRKSWIGKLLFSPFLIARIRKMLKIKDCSAIQILGAGESIAGIRSYQAWSCFTAACLAHFFGLRERLLYKAIGKLRVDGLFLPYSSDIEFFGYDKLMVSIPVERLRNFLEWMVKNENIDFVLPSEFLERSKVERKQYVKAGSWEPDRMVDVWWRDPDNMRLNALCDEARFYLIRGEAPEEGEGWKHLLLAENSDGRGWGPLPERRLDCYFHALKAIEIGKRKKN